MYLTTSFSPLHLRGRNIQSFLYIILIFFTVINVLPSIHMLDWLLMKTCCGLRLLACHLLGSVCSSGKYKAILAASQAEP